MAGVYTPHNLPFILNKPIVQLFLFDTFQLDVVKQVTSLPTSYMEKRGIRIY